MSKLDALLQGRDSLQQAMLYAVISKVEERDIKANKEQNVQRSIDRQCQQVDLTGCEPEIMQAVMKSSPFWREREQLARTVDRELVKKEIVSGLEADGCLGEMKTDSLIRWAQILALVLVAQNLKTSQIRKFLSGVRGTEVQVKRKPTEEFSRQEVVFLKVHLAYAKSRQEAVKPLMEVMTAAIDCIREEGREGLADFLQFVRFVEAVVAYHRFYGGSE